MGPGQAGGEKIRKPRSERSPSGLNHEINSPASLRFQRLGALAKVCHGDVLQDVCDGVADFFHDAADGAFGFVRTSAFLIELLTDTTYRRQRPFYMADDLRQRD